MGKISIDEVLDILRLAGAFILGWWVGGKIMEAFL